MRNWRSNRKMFKFTQNKLQAIPKKNATECRYYICGDGILFFSSGPFIQAENIKNSLIPNPDKWPH